MSQSVSFWKQEAQLLPTDHAMRNVNPKLHPNYNHNWSHRHTRGSDTAQGPRDSAMLTKLC